MKRSNKKLTEDEKIVLNQVNLELNELFQEKITLCEKHQS